MKLRIRKGLLLAAAVLSMVVTIALQTPPSPSLVLLWVLSALCTLLVPRASYLVTIPALLLLFRIWIASLPQSRRAGRLVLAAADFIVVILTSA